ncbi:MAG TPA: 50S ribosomal protein L4 [Candidatus Thalassarchaeaceae archaeon]|jgi:large subunit ribosomal protein L4e|nr:50S ribosomal protein L4 [Candidatus Thalassarchaeaceae archaeon]HJM40625.1 50S ribosomal protein L4 [Candidatus Thalassarchaeaceae archaeon]
MKVKTYELTNTIEVEELEAGIIIDYSIEAADGKNVTLPGAFESDFRPDLIRRAVHSSRANRRQPYGHREHGGKRAPQPGMKHSVEWWGKGRGVSRIMRKTGQRTGAQNPHTRGGRRAHGPMVQKEWGQKLNTKEANAARDSAIAATADSEMVAARGHQFSDNVRFPIVLGGYSEDGEDYDIESLPLEKATKKFIAMMESIGLGDDLTRSNDGRNIRAGKGKMRGRRRRTPRSILLVVAQRDALAKAARNVPGVDVAVAKDLCAEDLAPGGDAGRLTVWTKSAIKALE